MKIPASTVPVTLVFSAHDPTGAAGIQADIESINRNGGRSISILTALTEQNTDKFVSIRPQTASEFRRQAELLLEDIPVHACKTGLAGHPGLISEISRIVKRLHGLPVVVDPILHSGSGTVLSSTGLIKAYLDDLLPVTTVLTPNRKEALELSGQKNRQDAARYLLEKGCRSVLITGADDSSPSVINTLYLPGQPPIDYRWERLPGTFHGSGCTLASAVAARLALREGIQDAVEKAQTYTWQSLVHGSRLGRSQIHPDRNFRT